MSVAQATVRLTQVESKLLVRDPGSLFTFLIPLFVLAAFGSTLGSGGGTLVPITISLAIGLVALYLLPTTLASYRERGVLRRLAATPVRPASVLFVQLILQFVLTVVGCLALITTAGLAFGVSAPVNPAGAALAFLLGTSAMFGIGVLVAAVAPSARAANGVGVLLYFPMAYLAGLMQPAAMMPDIIVQIGEFTPLGATRRMLEVVWAGGTPDLLLAGVLAAYAVVVSLIAAKTFRWE
jgi:ABC-2 type transport system permease protein